MTNTNCLEGVRCPKCGHEDKFNVQVMCWMELTDGGGETYGDNETSDASLMQCCDCGYEALRKEFYTDNQPAEKEEKK